MLVPLPHVVNRAISRVVCQRLGRTLLVVRLEDSSIRSSKSNPRVHLSNELSSLRLLLIWPVLFLSRDLLREDVRNFLFSALPARLQPACGMSRYRLVEGQSCELLCLQFRC